MCVGYCFMVVLIDGFDTLQVLPRVEAFGSADFHLVWTIVIISPFRTIFISGTEFGLILNISPLKIWFKLLRFSPLNNLDIKEGFCLGFQNLNWKSLKWFEVWCCIWTMFHMLDVWAMVYDEWAPFLWSMIDNDWNFCNQSLINLHTP